MSDQKLTVETVMERLDRRLTDERDRCADKVARFQKEVAAMGVHEVAFRTTDYEDVVNASTLANMIDLTKSALEEYGLDTTVKELTERLIESSVTSRHRSSSYTYCIRQEADEMARAEVVRILRFYQQTIEHLADPRVQVV